MSIAEAIMKDIKKQESSDNVKVEILGVKIKKNYLDKLSSGNSSSRDFIKFYRSGRCLTPYGKKLVEVANKYGK